MATTWNRDVNINAKGTHILIKATGSKGPPIPPPAPPNNTTTYRINIHKNDRVGGGAKIIYHAKGDVKLIGIALKGGSQNPRSYLEAKVSSTGKTMTLTVKNGAGGGINEWHYWVQADVNGIIRQTWDPRNPKSPLSELGLEVTGGAPPDLEALPPRLQR